MFEQMIFEDAETFERLDELKYSPSDFANLNSSQPFHLIRNKPMRKKHSSLTENMDNLTPFRLPDIPEQLISNICARFLINIPHHELSNSVHVLFLCEEAYWFYLDFCLRDYDNKQSVLEISHNERYDASNPDQHMFYNDDLDDSYSELPRVGFKLFAFVVLRASGLLKHLVPITNDSQPNKLLQQYQDLLALINDWKKYKALIPVCGGIILDDTEKYVLMVKGYSKSQIKDNGSWSFPRGKMDEGEEEIDCACREVKEETGLDISSLITKEEYICRKMLLNDPEVPGKWDTKKQKYIKLFVIKGVSKKIPLQPRARYEIKEIKWFLLQDLYEKLTADKNGASIEDKIEVLGDEKFFHAKYFLLKLFNKYPMLKSKFYTPISIDRLIPPHTDVVFPLFNPNKNNCFANSLNQPIINILLPQANIQNIFYNNQLIQNHHFDDLFENITPVKDKIISKVPRTHHKKLQLFKSLPSKVHSESNIITSLSNLTSTPHKTISLNLMPKKKIPRSILFEQPTKIANHKREPQNLKSVIMSSCKKEVVSLNPIPTKWFNFKLDMKPILDIINS